MWSEGRSSPAPARHPPGQGRGLPQARHHGGGTGAEGGTAWPAAHPTSPAAPMLDHRARMESSRKEKVRPLPGQCWGGRGARGCPVGVRKDADAHWGSSLPWSKQLGAPSIYQGSNRGSQEDGWWGGHQLPGSLQAAQHAPGGVPIPEVTPQHSTGPTTLRALDGAGSICGMFCWAGMLPPSKHHPGHLAATQLHPRDEMGPVTSFSWLSSLSPRHPAGWHTAHPQSKTSCLWEASSPRWIELMGSWVRTAETFPAAS